MDAKVPAFRFLPDSPLLMKTSILTALAVLLIVSASRADEASHLALANQVVDHTTSKEALRSTMLNGLEPMMQRLSANGVPASVIDEVHKAVGEFFDKNVDFEAIRANSAQVYMSEFSEEDLKGLLAFYDSPLGKKVVEKMPIVTQKNNQFAQKQIATNVAQLQQTIGSVLQKYMPNLPKRPAGPGVPFAPPAAGPSAPAPAPAAPAAPAK